MRPGASTGAYTNLVPRQPITATPYALFAGGVSAAGISGNIPASQLTGTLNDSQFSANIPRLTVPNTAQQATGAPLINSGFITAATVTFSGSGYTTPPAVTVNAGSGSGAVITATVSGGAVASLNVTSAGSGYPPNATLTITPPPPNNFQVFVSSNYFTGINFLTNNNNVFAGNGAGLTNLNFATPPPGMVLIPAGAFTLGNSVAADTDLTDAAPVSTTLSAFYMDVNLVSVSQWTSVYYWALAHGYTFVYAGAGKAPNHPEHTVNWYEVVKWCNARSEQAGNPPVYYTDAGFTTVYRTGEVAVFAKWAAKGYRLPTEAEWEKAARGGLSGQRFPWGDVINQNIANYKGDTASFSYDVGPNGYNPIGSIGGTSPATSPVGTFAANGYGLHDMAGNVFEWCWDWYGRPYAGGSDPKGPASGSYRVVRGGSWSSYAISCRSASRSYGDPGNRGSSIGFRAVLAPGQS